MVLPQNKNRAHPDSNWGPFDLQSNALPLSYTPCAMGAIPISSYNSLMHCAYRPPNTALRALAAEGCGFPSMWMVRLVSTVMRWEDSMVWQRPRSMKVKVHAIVPGPCARCRWVSGPDPKNSCFKLSRSSFGEHALSLLRILIDSSFEIHMEKKIGLNTLSPRPATCQMVAEPTLFLSADDKVQVRAHRTKGGVEVDCVRDFMRMVANRDLSPTDAMTSWMGAASSDELRADHAIQDQYGVRFEGAYEPRSVCLTAVGLLVLLHYMDTKWKMVLGEYKHEVQQRLTDLAEGRGAEYVRDHDDGEVDEMMAAMAEAQAKGEGLEAPPENWRFFYGAAVPDPAAEEEMQVEEAVEEAAVPAKTHNRKSAFSLRGLMEQMDIKDDQAYMPTMGKTVSARFRERCPGSETFSKKKTTYFYEQDRECMEELVREEYLKYAVYAADADFGE